MSPDKTKLTTQNDLALPDSLLYLQETFNENTVWEPILFLVTIVFTLVRWLFSKNQKQKQIALDQEIKNRVIDMERELEELNRKNHIGLLLFAFLVFIAVVAFIIFLRR
jgi:Ca2+/Na+ antiporter